MEIGCIYDEKIFSERRAKEIFYLSQHLQMTLSYTSKQTRIRAYAFIMLAIMLFSAMLTVLAPMNIFDNMPTALAANTVTTGGGTNGSGSNNFGGIDVGSNGEITVGGSNGNSATATTFTSVIDKYKTVCTYILAIVTITMVIFMILQFTKLGAAGDNQMARKQAIGGILTTGIATALLGSLTIWFGFFYNVVGTA